MAWIGAVAGAAAAASSCHTGRRKKPNKFLLVLTMLIMVAGTFIPLGFFLLNASGVNFTIGPMVFLIFIVILGLFVFVLVAATAYGEDGEEKEEYYYTGPRTEQVIVKKPRSRKMDNWEQPANDFWGASSTKSSKRYCTSCGAQLDSEDLFCFSCGRRAN